MEVDTQFLEEFEEQLDPLRPEKSPIPAKLMGVGRLSNTYQILEEGQELILYTRMPFFDTLPRMDAYEKLYIRHNQQLKEIGLDLPEYGSTRIQKKGGQTVLYLFRKRQPPTATAVGIISRVTNAECFALARQILREINKVWKFNIKNRSRLEVSIDGRLSNWSVPGMVSATSKVDAKTELQYVPDGTPLMRENETELLDPELFFLRAIEVVKPIMKRRHLRDVLARFYDMRRICIDMLADFMRARSNIFSGVVDVANQFLSEEAAVERLLSITPEEVMQYTADAFSWKL